MKPILIYRPRQWPTWAALSAAVTLHVMPLCLAAGRVKPSAVVLTTCPFGVVEAEVAAPIDESDLQLPTLSTPENDEIPEERPNRIVVARHASKPVAVIRPVVPGPTAFGAAKTFAINSPRPPYPYEARRGRVTGSGVATINVDTRSGQVVDVTMSRSTGSGILDQVTLAALNRWRFKAGCPSTIRVPITFSLTGAVY